jgi:hypothetical protein
MSACNERTQVLFIACAGRSGSTLLDRVIGTHDGFCSVGELRFIWDRAFVENQLCGCGTPFQECPFWDDVSRRAFGVDAASSDARVSIRLRDALDGVRHAPWLLQRHSPAAHKAALALYGEQLERLYRAVEQVSSARVIVDSSGDATHGLILARLQHVDVHVVHLVRDPRAVAYSWTRSKPRPEIHWASEVMPIERASTSASRWVMQNTLAEALAAKAASYSRLSYEDFATHPRASLAEILAPFAGRMNAHATAASDCEFELGASHTVSGNPMRFQRGRLKVRLDDEWRSAMGRRDRVIVTAATWPLLARYGYTRSE